MSKNIPNFLSALRIGLALLMLVIKPFSVLFFILYLFCGISDILDGSLARRFHSTSELGATLDSCADLIMIFVMLYVMIPVLQLTIPILIWIAVIAVIRIASLAIAFIKFNELVFLHTYANKITGFLLFGFPVLYVIFGLSKSIVFLCVIASISAVEELLIQIFSKKLNRNIISLFFLRN